MDATSKRIGDYVAGLTYDVLPESAVIAAKRSLVDSMACAVAAYGMDAVEVVQKGAARYPATPGAGVLGLNVKVTPEHAGFANSTIVRCLDWNDIPLGCAHPSDNFGHIIAVADAFQRDGRALLLAAVVAYEIHRAVNPGLEKRSRAWDDGPIVAIAAACSTGKLLNLTSEQIGHAISIAAISNIALRATRVGELSMWRSSATAQAGRNGVFAAFLAQDGMTGPSGAFDGEFGFWSEIADRLDFDSLGTKDRPYAVELSTFKYFPACYVGQASIWAAQEVRPKVKPQDIKEIRIDTSQRAWKNMASDPTKWDPQTRETGDHSIPYVVSAMLTRGTIGVDDYTDEKLNDPAVRAIMPLVKVYVDDEMTRVFPDVIRTRMEVVTKGGQHHVADITNPRGHHTNPLTDKEVKDKFRLGAEEKLGKERCEKAIEWLWSIESAKSIGELFSLVEDRR